MSKRLPRRIVPHENAVIVKPVTGAHAGGRSYGDPVTIERSQIAIGKGSVGNQYSREEGVIGVVYIDTDAINVPPGPGSVVTVWPGTKFEQQAAVRRYERYEDPRIADYLVLVLE